MIYIVRIFDKNNYDYNSDYDYSKQDGKKIIFGPIIYWAYNIQDQNLQCK